MAKSRDSKSLQGFTLIELCCVVAICIIATGIAIPVISNATYNARLRSGAGELSGLIQQARILAEKNNSVTSIQYTVQGGAQIAYIGSTSGPLVQFNRGVVPASGAPSGTGQPTPYTLVGDTQTSNPYDNATTLGFSSRGLPCVYNVGTNSCSPPSSYFVYYLIDSRPFGNNGWAAVVVTRAGHSKVVVWDGTNWNS